MKKKFVYGKKVVSVMAAISIMAGTLSGCGNKQKNNVSVSDSGTTAITDEAKEDGYALDMTDGNSLLSSIKQNYAATNANEEYSKGLYNLASDYVFEFPAEKEAGNVCYDAFKVYDTDDLERENKKSYNWNTYENGVIKVAPDSVIKLDGEEGQSCKDGTWGSMNQLYLVQYIDLDTGKELEKPVITPFTVEHDLKSPVVGQGVDDKNNYVLEWKSVEGAKQYAIYERIDNSSYTLRATTTDTTISSRAFDNQADSEELLELFKNDLQGAGMEVDAEGIFSMNSGINVDGGAGYYVVVAIGDNGKVSGMSNIVDARDIAANLPAHIKDHTVELSIASIEDVPTYVEVEMVDGSVTQMIIDYHGAQAYQYPDDPNKITIKAHVANTEFDSFLITLTGMKYEDVVAQKDYFLDREDKLLANIRPADINIPTIEVTTDDSTPEPTEEATEEVTEERTTEATEEVTEERTTEATEEVTEERTTEVTEEVTEEVTTEVTEEVTEERTTEAAEEVTPGNTPAEQLMNEVSATVEKNLNDLGIDKVNQVFYANTDLGAWMAYCLIAQSEVIPAPISVFPEAANTEYLLEVLLEAYRQNPTSGLIDIGSIMYYPELEALKVVYVEDCNTRLSKTKQELDKAAEVAASVCDDSMSDYDKVVALNEYFRINASYDYDSMSTDVDINNLSESFIDAHAPYGILCENYGVCESYSEAFILTSRMAGLDSIAEIGTLFGGGHEWNRVKVDGSWCVLDITNNDNDDITNGLLNVSDAQIAGTLVPSKGYMVDTTPFAAVSTDKEFYYRNGLAVTNYMDAKDLIMELLNKESKVTVRVPAGTTEEQAKEVFQALVQSGAAIQKGNFAYGLLQVE